MKTFATLLGSACVLAYSGNCGYAADVYGGQSYKDKPVETFADPTVSRSGFYITGALGVANGDRSIDRGIGRGVDLGIDADLNGDGTVDPAEEAALQQAATQLGTVGIPSTLSDAGLNIPLIADRLNLNDSDSFSSAVFGGGVSYLVQFPNSRWGVSLGLDATVYNNAESSEHHTDAVGQFTGGTALADFNVGGANCSTLNTGTCAGEPAVLFGVPLTQSGTLSFDREFDIDVPIKLHLLSGQWGFNVGAGPSWARGSLSGGNAPTDGLSSAINGVLPGFSKGLTTKFDDDDTALGFVVTAGVQYWATDRLVIGVQGDYKHHTFEFDAASSNTSTLGGPISLTSHAKDSVEVEDDVYSVKATVSYKLN